MLQTLLCDFGHMSALMFTNLGLACDFCHGFYQLSLYDYNALSSIGLLTIVSRLIFDEKSRYQDIFVQSCQSNKPLVPTNMAWLQ